MIDSTEWDMRQLRTEDGKENVGKDLLEDHASRLDERKERRIAFGDTLQKVQRVSGVGRTDTPVMVNIYCG